jgi:hypothetical protein
MRFRWLAAFAAVAAISAATILSACGDDDSQGSGLRDYFSGLHTIVATGDTKVNALDADFPGIFDEVEATKQGYDAYVGYYQEFIDGLRGLDSPAAVAAAHKSFLEASTGLQELNRKRLALVEKINTADEIDPIFGDDPDYTAANERHNQTCADVRTVAQENGIEVDWLTCEG